MSLWLYLLYYKATSWCKVCLMSVRTGQFTNWIKLCKMIT